MSYTSHIVTSILLLAALLHSPATATRPGPNFVELSRYIAQTPYYALVCKRAADNVLGLTRYSIPKEEGFDTAGRALAIERCFRGRRDSLDAKCNRAGDEAAFAHSVRPDFRACVDHAPMNAAEAADIGPYKRPQTNCLSRRSAGFADDGSRTVYWVCECKSDAFYESGNALAAYPISGEADEVVRHFDAVMECSAEFETQMQDLCVKSPGNYEILGLQKLQTCCRRDLQTTETKFSCDAIVPLDVSDLKTEA